MIEPLPRLPWTDIELEVLFERYFYRRQARSVAHKLGLSEDEVRVIDTRARRVFARMRPLLDDPERLERVFLALPDDRRGEPRARRALALWVLSEIERFALVGSFRDHDASTDEGWHYALDQMMRIDDDSLPPQWMHYANVLFKRVTKRRNGSDRLRTARPRHFTVIQGGRSVARS